MDPVVPLRGLIAGLAAAGAMSAVEALAWARWGRGAVFEWQETEVVAERLLGRTSLRAALVLHVLFGGVAGSVFGIGVRLAPVAPTLVLGSAFGFGMWIITLLIHAPVTGSAARGIGVPVSLVSHLVYGTLLGGWV